MDKDSLRESLWRRGWNDTKAIWTSWPFYILDAVVAVVIGGIFGWYWGLAIVIFGTICVWMGATARAPVRQRDEARELTKLQRKPSDSEIANAIRLLEMETLLLRHNDGRKWSYPFTQVFLAIADQLSIGVSFISFENQIRKGLQIDDDEGWYFPYEDEGTAHLVGTLTQNALIERYNEEHQHMTRELVSGVAGIYLTPDAHLVKDTEVKYYLSPFGNRVIQQLRQQPTAHREGSAVPNTPKLASPELYITYLKHEFGVAGEGKYTGLSVHNGTPLLSIEAEYRPTGSMRIEAVKLSVAGESIPSLDCEVQESSDHIWYSPSNAFDVSAISLGKHDVTLAALANGEWWGSHPFPIVFP